MIDLLEPCTATKLDEELDFKMWTIQTMGEKIPQELENNSDINGKQRNNYDIQALEM